MARRFVTFKKERDACSFVQGFEAAGNAEAKIMGTFAIPGKAPRRVIDSVFCIEYYRFDLPQEPEVKPERWRARKRVVLDCVTS
jgi:hypothetical protein